MANLIIEYYENGKLKKASGSSIFRQSNLIAEISFKFNEDIGDNIVYANIRLPYPKESQFYGQYTAQSLLMRKEVDSNGGYIYSAKLPSAYLDVSTSDNKAYINAVVQSAYGEYATQNNGMTININGKNYTIELTQVENEILPKLKYGDMAYLPTLNNYIIDNVAYRIKEFTYNLENNQCVLKITSGFVVKTYQLIEFKIFDSGENYSYFPLMPTEADVIKEELAKTISDVVDLGETKQDKVDNNIIDTINIDNKVVVTSLNSANAIAKNNQDRLNDVDTQIGEIYGRIERLEMNISTGETYLGQVESSYAPNTEEAYNLVNQHATIVSGGNIKINSVIIYIQKLENDTDKIFKYTYGMNLESGLKEWSYYEIQYLESASNTTKGIVKGNYDSNNYVNGEVYVNIVDGNIQNIYFISNGRPTDIKEIFKYMEDVASGERPVEKALKDADGNEIATTYMPKSIGATKQLVKDYALPRIFNDILYLDSTTHNVVKSKDLLPDGAPSDHIVFNSIGEHKFPNYTYIIPQVEGESINFNISSKNSIRNKLTLSFTPTQTEALDFICRVYYAKLVDGVYEPNQLLGVNSIKIVPNEAIVNNEVIEVIFDELASVENNTIELQSGDKFIFEYAINSVNSTSTTAFLLTAKTASSCVNLNVDSVVKTILKSDVEEIDLSIGNPQSLTYDNVDGINLVETSKIIYTNGEENEIVSKREIPIVADKNIIMDVNENATKVLIKVDSTNTLDNSTKPVESGVVLNAINNAIDTLDASLDTKANKVTINTTSASPINLADNTSFRLGAITTLTINNATSYPLDFMCEVVFIAGASISIDYSALSLTWSGDDVENNVFIPQANKTYNILFFNNSNSDTASLQAIVRGV